MSLHMFCMSAYVYILGVCMGIVCVHVACVCVDM